MSPAAGRPPSAVLAEHHGLLTLRATESLYAEQPDLWSMGEAGRERTYEDFGHHIRRLVPLDADLFATHVRYCVDLFTQRGFPQRWLDDAWRVVEATLIAELPAEVATPAVEVLRAGVRAATATPPSPSPSTQSPSASPSRE